MPRKSTPLNMRTNCDNRMRAYIVSRAECERCGNQRGPFECAHIIRRRYAWTRTLETNAWCLCPSCHTLVDTHLSEHMALVAKTIGWVVFYELEAKSKRRDKFDWSSELIRWKAMT